MSRVVIGLLFSYKKILRICWIGMRHMGHASMRALAAHVAHRHACAQGRQTWSLGPSMQTMHALLSGSESMPSSSLAQAGNGPKATGYPQAIVATTNPEFGQILSNNTHTTRIRSMEIHE